MMSSVEAVGIGDVPLVGIREDNVRAALLRADETFVHRRDLPQKLFSDAGWISTAFNKIPIQSPEQSEPARTIEKYFVGKNLADCGAA